VLLVLAVIALGIGQLSQSLSLGGASASSPSAATGFSGEAGSTDEFSPEPEPEPESMVDSRGFPLQPGPQVNRQIRQVLLGYHQAVVSGEFRRAWRLLSKRKQRQALREDGYAKWREAQASLTPYLEPDGIRARVVSREGDGVARVDVRGMYWYQPNSPCSEWSGLTWVKYERGVWRYDPGYSTTPVRERQWKSRYHQLLGATC
jgi:hypothetical protein